MKTHDSDKLPTNVMGSMKSKQKLHNPVGRKINGGHGHITVCFLDIWTQTKCKVLTLVSEKVFYGLSNGTLGFPFHGSLDNPSFKKSDWLLKIFHNQKMVRWRAKQRVPLYIVEEHKNSFRNMCQN